MEFEKEKIRNLSIEIIEAFDSISNSPIQHKNEMISSIERCNNLSQLKMALSDMLEWTRDIKGAELEEVNTILASKGLPSLSLIRNKEHKKLIDILSKSKISNDSEYNLVMAYLNDINNSFLSKGEKSTANKLLKDYEINKNT
jgi:hypothetical protein